MNEKRSDMESVFPSLPLDSFEILSHDVMEICKNLIVENEELKVLTAILLSGKAIEKVVIEQKKNTVMEVNNDERSKKK